MAAKMPAGLERVLAVPRRQLLDPRHVRRPWRGVLEAEAEPYLERVRLYGEFRPRPELETDPSWKQIIPYLVVRDGTRYLLMRRTRAGGDERLFERYSIGVGGHLNPGDDDVDAGLRREWAEEVTAGFTPDFDFVGLLNDDEDPVGSVHLGFVYQADAAGRPVDIRETDKLSGAFRAPADVAAVSEAMESWSRLLFEHLQRAATEAG
jgi:predicted NUDIX family phosphoesterase